MERKQEGFKPAQFAREGNLSCIFQPYAGCLNVQADTFLPAERPLIVSQAAAGKVEIIKEASGWAC